MSYQCYSCELLLLAGERRYGTTIHGDGVDFTIGIFLFCRKCGVIHLVERPERMTRHVLDWPVPETKIKFRLRVYRDGPVFHPMDAQDWEYRNRCKTEQTKYNEACETKQEKGLSRTLTDHERLLRINLMPSHLLRSPKWLFSPREALEALPDTILTIHVLPFVLLWTLWDYVRAKLPDHTPTITEEERQQALERHERWLTQARALQHELQKEFEDNWPVVAANLNLPDWKTPLFHPREILDAELTAYEEMLSCAVCGSQGALSNRSPINSVSGSIACPSCQKRDIEESRFSESALNLEYVLPTPAPFLWS